MADYKVTYDTAFARNEVITGVARIECDEGNDQYVFTDDSGKVLALVPSSNVLSITRGQADA